MLTMVQLQGKKWYWIARWRVKSLWFHITKAFFAQKERLSDVGEDLSISKQLIAAVLPSVSISVILVVVAQLAWTYGVCLANKTGSAWLVQHLMALQNHVRDAASTIDTMLSVIAGVCGVFLGLYFTAIAVVAQTGFANSPGDIRDLLVREKAGNLYIRILTVLTSITVILLGLSCVGYRPTFISVSVVAVLGVFGIVSFVTLGLRAFYFFDPSHLAGVIVSDFMRNVDAATAKGFRWMDRSYQALYHRRGVRDISNLTSLFSMCKQQAGISSSALQSLSQSALAMLSMYAVKRRCIPSDSHWYAQIAHHKSWFLQDYIVVDMALKTHTPIQPALVADRYWVEDNVCESLLASWENAFGSSKEVVYESMLLLGKYLEGLSSELEVRKSLEIIGSVDLAIQKKYPNKDTLDQTAGEYDLAIIDAIGYCATTVSIGFFKHVRSTSVTDIDESFKKINWSRPATLYASQFPCAILDRLEHIHRCCRFERRAEGKLISPEWYLRQLMIMRYSEILHEGLQAVIASLTNLQKSAEEWLSAKAFVMAALTAHRGLELCFKIRGNLLHLKEMIDGFAKYYVCKDMPWQTWKWNDIDAQIKQTNNTFIAILAQCLPALSVAKHKESLPDFFGQSYSTVCQGCYEALREDDEMLYQKIFPLLFFSSLEAHDKLLVMLKDWEQARMVSLAAEPLMDIMSLSGYAKVYSELRTKPGIWQITEKVWQRFLSSVQNPEKTISFLTNIYSLRRSMLQAYPRDTLRMQWEMDLKQIFRQEQLIGDDLAPLPWRENRQKQHSSALIRALCAGGYEPFWTSAEVFIVVFLLKQPAGQGIIFKDYHGIAQKFKREEDVGLK